MLPGLNTEGTNIRVLPTYTPSNTALDFSALGSGFSQGMQLVGQAQQQRRLRDIMAEEQARRPLRDIVAARQMTEASQPIERTLYSFADELPDGGGLGRYEVRERVNPITGQIEQVNQFVEQVATPAQLQTQQAQSALKARQIEAEITERLARAEAAGKTPTRQPFKGETITLLGADDKPYAYKLTYDESGAPVVGERIGRVPERQATNSFNMFNPDGSVALPSGGGGSVVQPARAQVPTMSEITGLVNNLPPVAPPSRPAQQGAATVQFRMPGQEPQFSAVDQQALQWARSNPNDPRSALILQRLGLQ